MTSKLNRQKQKVRDLQKLVRQHKKLLACVPKNWLDPLLTGDKAVLGEPPWNCPDIERLCLAIRERMTAVLTKGTAP